MSTISLTLTGKVYCKIRAAHAAQSNKTEIAALLITDPKNPFRVTDLFFPRQMCQSAYVDMDADEIAEHFEKTALSGIPGQSIRSGWWHLHPFQSAHPSSTDWETFNQSFQTQPIGIMLISCLSDATPFTCHISIRYSPTLPPTIISVPVNIDWSDPEMETFVKDKTTAFRKTEGHPSGITFPGTSHLWDNRNRDPRSWVQEHGGNGGGVRQLHQGPVGRTDNRATNLLTGKDGTKSLDTQLSDELTELLVEIHAVYSEYRTIGLTGDVPKDADDIMDGIELLDSLYPEGLEILLTQLKNTTLPPLHQWLIPASETYIKFLNLQPREYLPALFPPEQRLAKILQGVREAYSAFCTNTINEQGAAYLWLTYKDLPKELQSKLRGLISEAEIPAIHTWLMPIWQRLNKESQ
jgi:hypothetical protein